MFLIKNVAVYNPKAAERKIDWKGLRKVLLNMNRLMKAPLVHKPAEILGFHLSRFNALFSKAFYVYIERDLLDVACSLANARLFYYNDLNKWWGSYPTEYKKISGNTFDNQIAGQVLYLQRMYDKQLVAFDSKKVVKISYCELCKNPQRLIDDLRIKIADTAHYKLKQVNRPRPLKPSSPVIDKKIKALLERSLHLLQSQPD